MADCSTGRRHTSRRGTSQAVLQACRSRKGVEGSIYARLPIQRRIRSLESVRDPNALLGLVERRCVEVDLVAVARRAPSRSLDVEDRPRPWRLMHCWASDRVVFSRSPIEGRREVQPEQQQQLEREA